MPSACFLRLSFANEAAIRASCHFSPPFAAVLLLRSLPFIILPPPPLISPRFCRRDCAGRLYSEYNPSKTSEISDLLSTYAGKEELLLQVGNPPACSCTLCGGRAGIRIASARLYYVKGSLIIN